MIENKNSDILSELVFPEDKEDYIFKNFGLLFLMCIFLYAMYINLDKDAMAKPFFFLFLLVFFIVMYKKIYMLLTVDTVLLTSHYFIIKYRKNIKKVPLNSIGIKITHDTGGQNV